MAFSYLCALMNSKRAVYFIFITILIDSIGIGIIYPVMATILKEVTGLPENEASTYGGWLSVTYALMQFIFAPVLGGLSDRFGRRPVILISLLGLGMDYLILAFAPTYTWLVLGRLVAGVCGASFTSASAYLADISKPEERAARFGMVGAAFGLGFIVGPFLGGIFSDMGSRVPFIAASVLSLLNFLYGFFVLPESLSPENRRKFEWKRANPFGAFAQLNQKREIRLLVFSMFLLFIAGQVMPVIWPYFTKFMFQWTDKEIGYSLAFVGVMVSIVQGGLIGYSQKRFGPHRSVIIGLFIYFLGLLLFAFADQAWMMYAWTFIYALGGIAPPSVQGMISSRVSASEQGELQGLLTAIMSLTSVISPIIMSYLFYAFTTENAPVFFPGAPFLAAAVLVMGAFLIYLSQGRKAG